MKIFRINDLKSTERPWGQLGNFGEQLIPEKAKTVGFWYPRIPPNGKIRAHAHKEQLEFMYFLNPGKIFKSFMPVSSKVSLLTVSSSVSPDSM